VRTLAVRFIFVAVIAVGGFIFRDRLSGGATDLKVGDCFDDVPGTVVKDVQHHPCTEAHNAEVILVTKNRAPSGANYPSDADLTAWASANCFPAILSYVTSSDDLDTLAPGIFYPKAEDWNNGERWMTCYVKRSGSPMTKSLKVGAS
jgi:hypothetical protein